MLTFENHMMSQDDVIRNMNIACHIHGKNKTIVWSPQRELTSYGQSMIQ
jgi:hypothetical protein